MAGLTKEKRRRRRTRQMAKLKRHNNQDLLMRMTNPKELLLRAQAAVKAKRQSEDPTENQRVPLTTALPKDSDTDDEAFTEYFEGLRRGIDSEGVAPEIGHIVPYSVFIKLAGHQTMSKAERDAASEWLAMTKTEWDDATCSGEFFLSLFGGHQWFTALMPATEFCCGRSIFHDTLESEGEDKDKLAWDCRHNLEYVMEHLNSDWVESIGSRVGQMAWAPVLCAIGREVVLHLANGEELSEAVTQMLNLDIQSMELEEVLDVLRQGRLEKCDCDGQ
jgi:hypothetical protein